jgi:ArsR family transcriptional regulator, cadmium/lead-responsive transcriptional repressor
MTATPVSALAIKAKLFRGLGDPSRLAIVEVLRDGEKTVSQIVEVTGLSQPNTSAHLACLKDCGIVVSHQQGRFVVYAIADDEMESILRAAEAVLERVGEQIFACTRYGRQP